MIAANNPKLYQHSGKIGFSPLLLIFAGIPLIILLSIIYSYLVLYIPISGYITILLLAGFAFGITMIVSRLAGIGKCRSAIAITIFGALAGFVALYFAWVSFLYALFARFAPAEEVTVAQLILNPFMLYNAVMFVNENGWFSIKGATPTNIVLWIFWAIEAVVIVGAPALFAASSMKNEMFCESCNKWCGATATRFRSLPAAIEAGGVKGVDSVALAALPELPQKSVPCIQEELLKCPACAKTQGLRFSRITYKADKNNKLHENVEKIEGVVLTHSL